MKPSASPRPSISISCAAPRANICRSPRPKTQRPTIIRPADSARIAQNRTKLSVGAPATVKARLEPLIAATQADELMVTSMIFSHEARKHSYELLAQAFAA